MNIIIWCLLMSGILLNVSAQFFLKFGMNEIGKFSFTLVNLFPILYKIITNYFIIVGLLCYVISVILWIMVLSRIAVSLAYPIMSIGYIFTAIGSYFLLGETITTTRICGIFIIILGVYLATKS